VNSTIFNSWGVVKTLQSEEKHKTDYVEIDSSKTTDYISYSNSDKYILILSGSGIITVDTVDYKVEERYTMLIKQNSNYLYANTDVDKKLTLIETSLLNNESETDTLSVVKFMN